MKNTRILLDTSVWISYFGNRDSKFTNRIKLAQAVVNYCVDNKMTLYYCPQVEAELNKSQNPKQKEYVKQMKNIAHEIKGHIGNEKWGHMSPITWDKVGTKWGDKSERDLGERLEIQLPDKQNKLNRVDRSILVSAIKEDIHIFLHENPNDFKKINISDILIIDLLSIQSLSEFTDILSNNKLPDNSS